MNKFGSREKFSIEVGIQVDISLWEVDIWAGNQHLTHLDNIVYLPQFLYSLECEVILIRNKDTAIEEPCIFFQHGPTTDDASGSIKLSGDNVDLTFELYETDELVNVVMSNSELCDVMEKACRYLKKIST